jgi:hypothetical protein
MWYLELELNLDTSDEVTWRRFNRGDGGGRRQNHLNLRRRSINLGPVGRVPSAQNWVLSRAVKML